MMINTVLCMATGVITMLFSSLNFIVMFLMILHLLIWLQGRYSGDEYRILYRTQTILSTGKSLRYVGRLHKFSRTSAAFPDVRLIDDV